jgi:tetratricopeptide (TPR) repeat protein
MNNEKEIRAPGEGLKERILKFVSDIPEAVIKTGIILAFIVGLFVFVWFANLLLFGGIPPLAAIKLALIEISLMIPFLMVALLVYKLLIKGEGRIWSPFGKRKFVAKSGPELYRAEKYQQKGEYSEAIKEYRKLFTLSPDRLDFLYAIAEIYRNDLKDNEKAVKTHMVIAKYDGSELAKGYEYHIGHSKDILKHAQKEQA